ncbi:amino acid permease-domain-containing protein [Lophiotrema nucula]|uniref:Amino acid permease-domain-containing protein n=1 Tax=Lophiotrema nucula TaxID=690887 RepID=A0A6A5YWR9_9PLEO|nr:amino acid permease-domain-containing protein [Lophiotrema nucula]
MVLYSPSASRSRSLYHQLPQEEETSNSTTAIEMEMEHKTPTAEDAVLTDSEMSLNVEDKEVMAQIGKKQQLARRFNLFTIFGLSMTLLSSWEAIGSAMGISLLAGGPVALIYGLLFVGSGTLACAASIAEMASICPISGAQYHWTFMFSPKRWRVWVTFVQGWVTVFAWQATITSLTFLIAAQIQGVVVLNYPDYVFERWHTTLMMWLVVIVAYAGNVWGIKLLPTMELISGSLHIVLFIVLFIVMLVLGRNASASFVFTGFVNETGWSNDGVAWFIGLLPCIWCITGFDGAIHLSEETSKSSTTIPRVIITTVIVNGTMAWIFVLLCLFSISDIDAVLGTATGYPLIEIMYQVSRTHAGATAIMSFILTISMAAMFGTLASVSRLTWAFARDDGLPWSGFFKHVDGHYKIPIRSIGLVSMVIVLLSLINIGSSTALNAILSLATIALYTSYIIPISCLIAMRLRVKEKVYDSPAGHAEISEERLVFGPWNLGRLPLTATTMNYAGPVFGLVLLFAAVDFLVRGRFSFVGPTRER